MRQLESCVTSSRAADLLRVSTPCHQSRVTIGSRSPFFPLSLPFPPLSQKPVCQHSESRSRNERARHRSQIPGHCLPTPQTPNPIGTGHSAPVPEANPHRHGHRPPTLAGQIPPARAPAHSIVSEGGGQKTNPNHSVSHSCSCELAVLALSHLP